MLTYWKALRSKCKTVLSTMLVANHQRRCIPAEEDHSEEEHSMLLCWVVRNRGRFGDYVILAAVNSITYADQACRVQEDTEDSYWVTFRDVAAYAAQRWAEAALRVAMEENRKP